MSEGFVLVVGSISFVLFLALFVVLKSKSYRKQIESAALALGDNYYVTGIPNNVWKKYARSFPEYERLVHALARSGDTSPENVQRFVMSFTDSHVSHKGHVQSHSNTNVGVWGYGQIGNDQGYWQSRQFNGD